MRVGCSSLRRHLVGTTPRRPARQRPVSYPRRCARGADTTPEFAASVLIGTVDKATMNGMDENLRPLARTISLPLLGDSSSAAGSAAEAIFKGATDELLGRAGGGLSLTAVAERLGVSRQRVHKRIQEGTILGMRGLDGNIVIPAFQVETGEDGQRIMPGLEHAVRPFMAAGEGGWATLQWLLDQDPNLSATPVEAVRAGRFDDVARAARAYVGADGG